MPSHKKPLQFRFSGLDDFERQLERLRTATAFPGSEELKRQLDQIKAATRFPALEAVKQQLEQLRSATEIPGAEELKRQLDRIGTTTTLATLDGFKRQLEDLRLATAFPASEELKRQLDQIKAATRFPALEAVKQQIEQLRIATSIPGSEELKRQLDQIRAAATLPAFDGFKRQMEQLQAATALPGSEELKRNLEILTSVSATQSHFGKFVSVLVQKDFSAALNAYAYTFDDDQLDDLRLQADGSFVVDGEQIAPSEMQSTLESLFDQSENLLTDGSYLTRLRRPLRKIAKFLLQAFLGAFIQIILTPYLDQSTTLQFQELKRQLQLEEAKSRREIQAAIKELARSNQDFSQWRIVSSSRLAVKVRRGSKAKTLATLPLGTVVRVLEKHSHWTMVEYESPDSNMIEKGWVLSKYLKRIG
jgi:hypothetical protein